MNRKTAQATSRDVAFKDAYKIRILRGINKTAVELAEPIDDPLKLTLSIVYKLESYIFIR